MPYCANACNQFCVYINTEVTRLNTVRIGFGIGILFYYMEDFSS